MWIIGSPCSVVHQDGGTHREPEVLADVIREVREEELPVDEDGLCSVRHEADAGGLVQVTERHVLQPLNTSTLPLHLCQLWSEAGKLDRSSVIRGGEWHR